MSYLVNDPDSFTDEMMEGLLAAHGDVVRGVDGGVVRATGTPAGQVAVVIGGGSGHYPAFAGLVGPGLAHGSAMGNTFASPSAQDIYTVARAAASDAGVLFSYGNYAGDVLNFDLAQERLRAEGIPTRTVVVTDDISSAGPQQRELRRGVAGDLVVFRAAAWAAEQGRDLDGVWAVADHANERTRTLGVAFSGCTLPGARAPLFSVPKGRMAVGMGIHGEPGIREQDVPSARDLADLLVDALLPEAPADFLGHRLAVVVNGLGSVKSEELFVVFGRVATRLEGAGLTLVAPEVGEFATSFEMAGLSLTLTWLDDELLRAWVSPAAAAGYRRGAVTPPGQGTPIASALGTLKPRGDTAADAPKPGSAGPPPASDTSREEAHRVVEVMHLISATITEHVDELGRLDSVAGDGDHGIGMQRGARAAAAAARQAVDAGAGSRTALAQAGDAWAARAGGTSGALWGLGLRALSDELSDDDAGTATAVATGVDAARRAIERIGKARLGDKTMLDALIPFCDVLNATVTSGASLSDGWSRAADAATVSARDTASLHPQLGRARVHHERSVGTPDPGAVSLALIVTAVAPLLRTRKAVQ